MVKPLHCVPNSIWLTFYIYSNCERPTILLISTKVDSPEQILSSEEEKSILKNSMDFLNSKAKDFLLFNEVIQTSSSPSSHTLKNKTRSFGSIRKLLCSLSELSTSHKSFFVPHNWELLGKKCQLCLYYHFIYFTYVYKCI